MLVILGGGMRAGLHALPHARPPGPAQRHLWKELRGSQKIPSRDVTTSFFFN